MKKTGEKNPMHFTFYIGMLSLFLLNRSCRGWKMYCPLWSHLFLRLFCIMPS